MASEPIFLPEIRSGRYFSFCALLPLRTSCARRHEGTSRVSAMSDEMAKRMTGPHLVDAEIRVGAVRQRDGA